MNYTGQIAKMNSSLGTGSRVNYRLPIGDDFIGLNDLIGKKIQFSFNGLINCIKCGTKIKKSFRQGFCYPCFMNAPEASECIFRPELCKAHEGESRDMDWSNNYCLKKHYIYMSFTGNIKIGVTREILVRWIDQGATKGLLLCQTPNRYLAGLIEVKLKEIFSDRTNWRKMLSGNFDEPDFKKYQSEALKYLEKDFSNYIINDSEWQNIKYPIHSIPEKINSFSFDKEPLLEDKLVGIKGQYLMFENNKVLNIRKHTGYTISVKY